MRGKETLREREGLGKREVSDKMERRRQVTLA
jgi:hypothetical protein